MPGVAGARLSGLVVLLTAALGVVPMGGDALGGPGCPSVVAAVGDHIFMRSGGAQTDLVLLQQHVTCAVADVHAAEAN